MELLNLARQRAAAAAEALAALERAAEGVSSEEARVFLRAPLAEARAAARDLADLVEALQDGRVGHVEDAVWRLEQAGYHLVSRREEQAECPLCDDDAEIVYVLRNGLDAAAIRACAACGLAREVDP